jgi:hypothetical protein
MGWPVQPNVPQALVALQPLTQQAWSGQLQPVAAGQSFWASLYDAPGLIAAGQARSWIDGADPPMPPVEPAKTAHGSAGFGAGTSNCSPG